MADRNRLVGKLMNLASLRNDLLMGWKLIWQASRGWSIVWLTIHVVLGCIPLAQIALVKFLVDSVTRGLREGMNSSAMRQALIYGVLMAAVVLLNEALQSLLDWVKALQAERIRDYVSALVHRKSVEVDLEFYESPEYFDSLYRARDDAQNRPLNLLDHLGNVLQTGITLTLFAAIVATYGPWMLVSIVLSMAPAVFIVLRHNRLIHEWWEATTVQRRWADYYDQRFVSPAAAPEMRLFNLGDYFHSEYQAIRDQLRTDRLGMIRNQTIARLGSTVATLAIVGASIGWVGWRVVHGKASLGDLALCYQAFLGGQSLMRMCTASLGHIYNDALFLGTFFQFLATKPKICSPEKPVPVPARLRNGVRFRNVTFHYPGSDALALRNLNLFIPAGRVVAIVGKNGAGKSTLVKLMSRFYDPEAGSIELDGIDLRTMDVQDLRNNISILFQTPPSYDASVADNIRYGDMVGNAGESRIVDAARSAGADEFIERLPNGYCSLLGKSFENGNELSAGQWQRIAMARAYLRRSPLVLLDEPTSFMDPWAEHDWFERLRGLGAGRTAVIITHRFSIAMRADLIHLMDAGEVLESGTHPELVARNGLYAESWKLQMQAHADCIEEEQNTAASFAD
jgi:ATP-binding cassette subfamily B protein